MGEGKALGASADRFPSVDPKEGSLPCRVMGCSNKTSDKKPFCIDHLVGNPHARRVMHELRGMTPAQILGPPEKKERRRQVVPIEFQVGASRFWVALVKSRGIEVDPEPVAATNPRRLRSDFSARCRPFTRLLSRDQSRLVLLLLQERRADRIPETWLVDDAKLIDEVMQRFSAKG